MNARTAFRHLWAWPAHAVLVLSIAGLSVGLFGPAAAEGTGLRVTSIRAHGEPFPGFSSLCPQPIIYRATWRFSLAERDGDGNELIVLDNSLRLPVHRYQHNFLAAHECAHHLMGDTTSAGVLARLTIDGAIAEQELAADCWAAEYLSYLGRDREVAMMAEAFYRRGDGLAVNGYPSGMLRARTLKRCGKQGEARRLSGGQAQTPEATSLTGFD